MTLAPVTSALFNMTAPEKSTNNFSIRLNSDGLCFICQRDCSKANGGGPSSPTSFRLRNITRFLGIDTKKILKAYLDYDLKRCSDVKVELCEGCSEQVQKFNCLYQTLELTKLKLNECVRKISSLIKEAEEECADDDRTGKMERRVTHSATRGVIVGLRAGITAKCLEFSKTVLPRVILKKRLPETELTNLSSLKPSAVGTAKESSPNTVEVSEEHHESRSSTEIPASQISHPDSESVISEELQRTQAKSGLKTLDKACRPDDGKFPCPFCKAVLPDNRELHLHLVSYHLQAHFFPEKEYKEPSLSSRQFIDIVLHLLFKNIFTEHPVTESASRCPHCSKTYQKNQPSCFRLHIIRNHQASLVQRLNQLQKDPMTLQSLKNTKTWVCKCGDHFASHKTRYFHQLRFCNLSKNALADGRMTVGGTQLSKKLSKNETVRTSTSCPHCRAVIKTPFKRYLNVILREHLTRYHLHTFFPEDKHKEPSFSPLQFKQVIHHFLFEDMTRTPDPGNKEVSLKCPHCDVTHMTRCISRFKVHLIKFHFLKLAQRLEELQKDPLVFERLRGIRKAFACECGDYFTNRKPFEDHQEKFCNRRSNDDDEGEGGTNSFSRDEWTTCEERDPLGFEDEMDLSTEGPEEMGDIEVGDVKPCISILPGTESLEDGDIGAGGRKRRRSQLDSDPVPPKTKSAPQKILKMKIE